MTAIAPALRWYSSFSVFAYHALTLRVANYAIGEVIRVSTLTKKDATELE